MALPFVSLDAATAVGPGETRDLGDSYDHHTMIVSATGGASWAVYLQGSHDNVNWLNMGGASYSVNQPVSTPTSMPHLLVRYVRANLTQLDGGSSPTVTATIASDTTGED